jgi:hypothetical protein
MVISGVLGVSGLGSFVLSRGYTLPVPQAPPFLPEGIFTKFSHTTCTISPRVPIALIVKIKKPASEFKTFPKVSENTIPQT